MTASGPGLVEQLQSDAMNDSVPITVLLRKAKAAAVKLRQTELADWIEHEISGYPPEADVPEYRVLYSRLKFFNPVRGWCPVVGGDSRLKFGGSMGEIAALMAGGDCAEFMSNVPIEVVRDICDNIGFNVDVKRWIGRSSVAAIVEAVRNTIHDWALKLEQAGIRGEGISFSPREAEQARSVVVNIGSIGNATGIGAFGDNATITANQTIDVKQFAREVREFVDEVGKRLETSGLPSAIQSEAAALLSELKIDANAIAPNQNRLRQSLNSLKHIMEGTAGNLIAAGVVALIVKLLSG